MTHLAKHAVLGGNKQARQATMTHLAKHAVLGGNKQARQAINDTPSQTRSAGW